MGAPKTLLLVFEIDIDGYLRSINALETVGHFNNVLIACERYVTVAKGREQKIKLEKKKKNTKKKENGLVKDSMQC